MAFIKTIDEHEATGSLKRIYDDAIKRAGKVFNVVKIQSLRPHVLRQSLAIYSAVMHGPSSLSRSERELLAVVVSATNHCHY